MSASYDGTDFYERGANAGLNIPRWESKFNFATKIIPNGSPVVQKIGVDAQRLAMPIRCTASQLGSLESSCDGSSHTLSWSGGSDSAVLESITGAQEVKPGVDMFFATLNFIRI
jgi:hypothetical protein